MEYNPLEAQGISQSRFQEFRLEEAEASAENDSTWDTPG